MRKNLLMLAVILLTALMANAETSQTVTATLNHDGNATTFMGGNGMRDALNAAVDGDAIILSPGTFNAADIKKAVTLRGAGATMLSLPGDSIQPTDATYITGEMSINIESTEGKLAIEGIQFNNRVSFVKAPAVDVFKTRISEVTRIDKNVASINFTHCLLYINESHMNEHTTMVNTVAYLSYLNPWVNALNCMLIGNRYDTFSAYSSYSGGGQLTNCIITFENDHSISMKLSSNCTAYNCVACCKASYNDWNLIKDFFEYSYNGTNQVVNGVSMFNAEDAVPVYPFYLTEDAAAQYLGNDGTQVGIHGGSLPIDPIPDNLLVTKCNIAPKTTATGKLQIEIQVSTAK